MAGHDYLKNLSESQADAHRAALEQWGYSVVEDRDNFDYLYHRTDLAELSGKTYHKKRNLVNAFINSYDYEQKPLKKDNVRDALDVLERMARVQGIRGRLRRLPRGPRALRGPGHAGLRLLRRRRRRPAGASASPSPAVACSPCTSRRGSRATRASISSSTRPSPRPCRAYFKSINREQDLGDEGLRQAKMTYRPSGFVNKYRVVKA